MIVLTHEPGEADKLAAGAPTLQRRHGMPIHPAPYDRPASSEPACRAVVAARLHAPWAEARTAAPPARPHHGGRAARRPGADRGGRDRRRPRPPASSRTGARARRCGRRCRPTSTPQRAPSAAARALDHKLGGPPEQRPLHGAELRDRARRDDGVAVAVPGFNPVEAYEAAIANLAPELARRPNPETVSDVLAWAGEPLATAEVAAVAQLDPAATRAALAAASRGRSRRGPTSTGRPPAEG